MAARKNEHRTLGPSLADLAEVRCAQRRAADGLALLDEAERITVADYPDKPWRAAWVENIRGECLMRAGRLDDGRKEIEKSSPIILAAWPAGTLFGEEANRRLGFARP